MPKIEIDYSNTIIYKITCKDTSVTDLYVGHTTNFVQRKHAHKNSCITEKSCNYKCKLYDTIRKNGGWDNWQMEIIGFYNCVDHYEARKKEQEFFISLNATLNSLEPLPKPKVINMVNKYYCKKCDLNFTSSMLLKTHNIDEHLNTTNNYSCKWCDYVTCKKSHFKKHLSTEKHIKQENDIHLVENIIEKLPNVDTIKYTCQCGKIYKYDSGYYRHKKKCIETIFEPPKNEINDKDLILLLLKQNSELLEIIKNGTNNNL